MRPVLPRLAPLEARLADPAYLVLRLVAGGFLVPHGLWKLFSITGGTRADMIAYFAHIGLQPAALLVTLVGIVEACGGFLIAVGLLTRPAALAATVTTGVAALYVHLPLGFYVEGGGTEFASLWAVVLLFIAVMGGGRLAIDRRLGREF
jgi:putative oxidoreductase